MNISDTIAAISSPPGKGGVALLRVSGPDAVTIAERVFRPASGKSLGELPANMTVYGHILFPEPDGTHTVIDDGMAVCFHAPRSFTGEDTVEISCHGGVLITARVLSALLAAGARQAEAGAFTRRAFVNGKLDLTQAEALGTLLEAQTTHQLTLARAGMAGLVGGEARRFYEQLRQIVASVYAVIDFPDEDLAELSPADIRTKLNVLTGEMEHLLASYKTGKAVSEGIRTVITGHTNVGKSSLYNQLVGRDAAIVTDIAGTTRDILEETVSVGPVLLRLCDTAGLRESHDQVESIGIARARQTLEKAEFVLAVFDVSTPLTAEDIALADKLAGMSVPFLALLNKCDKPAVWTAACLPFSSDHILSLSTATGEGMAALSEHIQALFMDGTLNLSEDAVLFSARQYAALCSAVTHVRDACRAMDDCFSADISCVDLELAMENLAEIDGRAVTEDIVSQIFSHFCVGK